MDSKWWGRLAASLALMVGAPTIARADCLSLISGPIVYDVTGCKLIEPESLFDTSKPKYSWIAGLDPAGKKKFYDSYRGLYVKGTVVKSQAVQKGLSNESGALAGETLFMYVPPGQQSCAGVMGKRVTANLQEICCSGGGDPPCLLNTSYILRSPQAIGAVSSGAGDATRQRAAKSKDYAAGDQAFRKRQWKVAAQAYERARANGDLDIKGHFKLGYAYREMDQCRDAVRVLRHVHEQHQKKAVWADEEKVARHAIFLLARCHSKLNEPGAAVLLLNSYLLEPEKYQRELQQALTHKDFGWIHTSKEYREFKQEAQKKLRKK